MDPATLTLLAYGLITVFGKLIERAADITLDKSLETLIINYGAEKVEHREAVQKALDAALEAARKSTNATTGTRLGRALNKIKDNRRLAVRVAAAVVGMVSDDPARLPPELLKELDLPDDQRAAFSHFLFGFRRELLNVEGYGEGIRYADELDQRGLLRERLNLARREIEIDETLLADRRLTTDDAKALHDYIALVREQSRYLPLPLARRSGPEARADVELAEVFVPLTLRDPQEEEKARRRAEKWTRSRAEAELELEETAPASFGDVFVRYPCFLLKGPPGCGKTTLLRRAALAFIDGSAQADLGWVGPALLPIFIRLRNFGVFLAENRARFPGPAPGALTAFMENYFREEHRLALSPGFFDRRLAEGRCLILLDGLDEVAANRPEVAQHVNAFVRHFKDKGNRFGLASRPKGYEAVEVYLRPAALAIAEVNPLGEAGIRQLVGNLMQAIESNPARRAKDAADLPQQILASRDLTLIAGTPLFCTALVLVYKYHGAQLPQRRVEVYQEIVDLLLGFWKAQERELARAHELAQEDGTGAAFADVSAAVAIKQRRLAHLALWMQQEQLTDAPTVRACAVLADYLRAQERKDPETAAQWAENFLLNAHERSGILAEVEAGTHAFTHQGFREYLAATALTNQRESTFVRTVLEHVADDWWEQVVLLAGAHPALPDAARAYLVQEMLRAAKDPAPAPKTQHAHLLMAGQCAVDMAGYLPGPERELVERALLHLMRDTSEGEYPNDLPLLTSPEILAPKVRLEAGLLLDALGWTPPDLNDFILVDRGKAESRTQKADSEPAFRLLPAAFWISKYPVTNLQYQCFLEAPDYADEKLWAEELVGFDAEGRPEKDLGAKALQWFKANGEKERRPGYWDDPRFGVTHRLLPVVGVTWYEAAAYCAWLTRHWADLPEATSVSNLQPPTSNPQFRLPAEREWVAAAGGEANNRYPWQTTSAEVTREEVLTRANTAESDLSGASPVCMYPAGISRPGVMDMGGNVWEWQANLYKKGEVWRALRGGAWYFVLDSARVAARIGDHPDFGWDYVGFRVVGASPVSRS